MSSQRCSENQTASRRLSGVGSSPTRSLASSCSSRAPSNALFTLLVQGICDQLNWGRERQLSIPRYEPSFVGSSACPLAGRPPSLFSHPLCSPRRCSAFAACLAGFQYARPIAHPLSAPSYYRNELRRVPFLFVLSMLLITMRYEVVRSVSDKNLHVIFNEGAFAALPDRIRHLGPWKAVPGGVVASLKLHYGLQLAEQGFVVLHQSVDAFSADRP